MNVRDLVTQARDLEDAVAQFAGLPGVTEDQFVLTPLGFWIWQPPDAETWERAYAAHEASRPPEPASPRHSAGRMIEVGDF